MLVIVNVAATVVVLKTVVAGTKKVFVRVFLLPVTVAMPKAMPLLTVTVGVVTTVWTRVVVPVTVTVGAVDVIVSVAAAELAAVIVMVGWSGARFCSARAACHSSIQRALTLGSTARPSMMARLNSVMAERGRAVGAGTASRSLMPMARPKSASTVATMEATGSGRWRRWGSTQLGLTFLVDVATMLGILDVDVRVRMAFVTTVIAGRG